MIYFVLTALTLGAKSNGTIPFNPNGNYFAKPGMSVVDDTNSGTGPQPSTDARKWVNLDTDASSQGWIEDNIMLQVCDGRFECDGVIMHARTSTTPGSYVEFFKRDSDKTAYIHLTRCTDSVTGTNVTAPVSGGAYKRCANTNGTIKPISSFKLPPFLCEQSCDKDPTCTMYTVDKAGQSCWLSKGNEDDGSAHYIKIPNAGDSI